MKRTQVQIDQRTYEALRRRAFERGSSISSMIRELLARSLGTGKVKKRLGMKDFTFIGSGRSSQGPLSPVSERHDEALAEAWKAPCELRGSGKFSGHAAAGRSNGAGL